MDNDKETIENPRKLQQQLKTHLEKTGKLSSSDVAQFTRGQDPAEPKPSVGQAMHATTEVDTPGEDKTDPMIKAADGPTSADAVTAAGAQTAAADLNPMSVVYDRRHKVVITPEDKEAFIAAVINNTRMELTFPLMGGKARVRIRSRKIPETRAIVARERYELDHDMMETRMDYTLRLRAMLMAAQVVEFRGETFPELEAPLLPEAQAEGEAVPIGWAQWIDHWAEVGDATHAMLWGCVQAFEDKYWRMVEDAQDADFWQPAAST
jgi:hypothetical protein